MESEPGLRLFELTCFFTRLGIHFARKRYSLDGAVASPALRAGGGVPRRADIAPQGHRLCMPILVALVSLVLLAVTFGPSWWVRSMLMRHGVERPDFPGTGAELARHLLDEAGLQAVTVEQTDTGDHYDPEAGAVRLLPQHHDGRSVSAVAVAAHEVSHAVQHARGEPAFARRFALVRNVIWFDRAASVVLLLSPLVFAFVHVPALMLLQVGAGLLLLAVRVAVHAVTLPVEFDASFGKALPVLMRGGYLSARDLPAARTVLWAAALTYVAAALRTLLDVARWFRILRF
jgi:Zn-dependent membrane protease YugP